MRNGPSVARAEGEIIMSTTSQSIGGLAVTTKLAMKMEDSLQAFAVRAACFIGELDVPYSEEFDGHDFGATHIIAYVGDEPVGAVRVRWFKSFAMPERLAVIQRFRGNGVAQLLLERCRKLAETRGAEKLYVQVLPQDAKHWEKQGWRRLEAEDAGSSPKQVVAMIRAVDPSKPLPEADDAPESVVLRRDQQADGSVVPMRSASR
ncbi:MAG: GNAT family N-acetyltransferase [Reyranella sp.]|nr:MAG: GNAT family N-acetyltransferase [Reyranella sp.]